MEVFDKYYDFLIQENQKYDLTNITDYEEVKIKHFEDSLSLEKALDLNSIQTVLDIGSGAGFPGIPLKIKYPHLQLTIIEPTLKRCNFLKELVCRLGLSNVIIICNRAEDAIEQRGKYDLVCARAVARMNILLELAIPLVKTGGLFVAYKGQSYLEEIEESKSAFKELSCFVDNVYAYELKKGYGKHFLVIIKKEKDTNIKYPRKYSQIKKNSL